MTGVAWTDRPPPVPPVPVAGGEGDAGIVPSPVNGNENPEQRNEK